MRKLAIGVATTVLGSIILVFLTPLSILKMIGWMWSLVISTYPIPGWALLVSSPFVIASLVRVWSLFVASEKDMPGFHEYMEDNLFHLKWRWQWANGRIANLNFFCPVCDNQIVESMRFDNPREHGSFTHRFRCDRCDEMRGAVGGVGYEVQSALDKVTREIQRRIRTGEYTRDPAKLSDSQ